MMSADVPTVVEIDRESYPTPWPASAYRREISSNRQARYVVLREIYDEFAAPVIPPQPKRTWRSLLPLSRTRETDDTPRPGQIVGYAGLWIVADEAHVTTIAVRHSHRGRGLGELLLSSLIEIARDIGARWITLEVRTSNDAAQKLYTKYGFREAGLRKQYYSDNKEDALIMTTDDVSLNAYQARLHTLRQTLSDRLANQATALVNVAGPNNASGQ